MTEDEEGTLDLHFYYVELGTEFALTYGYFYDTFLDSMESVYNHVLEECRKNKQFENRFKDRLYELMLKSEEISWLHDELILDIYYFTQRDPEEER